MLKGASMNKTFIAKSLLIWLSITPLAILNGALREYLLLPLLGTSAYPLSGILLAMCIFIVSYILIPRLGRGDKRAYITMGLVWVLATLIFETLVGIIIGTSFIEMLETYNIFTGNLWLFIVILIGFIPTIVAKMKKLNK
jgi:hypothetical protein